MEHEKQVPAAEVRAQALEEAMRLLDMQSGWTEDEAKTVSTCITLLAILKRNPGMVPPVAQSSTADKASEVRAAEWISVEDRLPEVGQLVMVYSPPTKYDYPGGVNIAFDCIDANDDDHASWLNHNEHYEHFCCVAKPEGSVGPSAEAPYTHWMNLPATPSTADSGNTSALGEGAA